GAYQGPWCAVENVGGDVRYDCGMRTLEQGTSLIIAGNRGFCNPNPYYRGPEAAAPRVKRKRWHYWRCILFIGLAERDRPRSAADAGRPRRRGDRIAVLFCCDA